MRRWNLNRGQPKFNNNLGQPKWLLNDGVDDAITFNDSSFYNLEGSDFTFAFKVIVIKIGPGAGTRQLCLFSKGATSDEKAYLIGTCGGNYREVGFRLNNNFGSQTQLGIGVPLTSFDIEQHLGEELNISYIRQNQNGTLAAALNPANYFVEVNGTRYACTQLFATGTVTEDPFNNVQTARMNGTSSVNYSITYSNMYAFYRRALLTSELTGVFSGTNVPVEGNRGYIKYNNKYGPNVEDSSSVNNNGTIIGASDADLGTNNPSLNRYWISNVLIFNRLVSLTKSFTAPSNLSIIKAARRFSYTLTAVIVHKREGATLNTYTWFESENVEEPIIGCLTGDVLEFTIDYDAEDPNLTAIELFYSSVSVQMVAPQGLPPQGVPWDSSLIWDNTLTWIN